MFKYLYIFFLFCVSVLSTQFYLLPLTPRQLMAVIMFFVCLFEEKKFWLDKLFFLYLIFVFCYGLSSLITGYFPDYLKRLIGDYFVAYVALWSVKILITKYKDLNVFLYAFIVFGLFDGVVTLFQFLGISYLDAFLNRLQLISYNPYLDNYQGTGAAMLLNCPPGVFSHPVLNAHALVASTVLSSLVACKKNSLIGSVITLFMLVCLFSTQQRTAFAIGLLSLALVLYITASRSKFRMIIIPSVIVIVVFGTIELYDFIMNGEFRFSELGLDSTGRDEIYKYCIDYIKNNPLGGINDFVETTKMYPHNIVFNAFIFGGWVGGLFLLYIVLLQLWEIFKSIRKKNADITEIIVSLAMLSLIVNGLTHNQSIVNGEVMTWSIWGAYYYSKKIGFEKLANRELRYAQRVIVAKG